MVHIVLEYLVKRPLLTTIVLGFSFNRLFTSQLVNSPLESVVTYFLVYVAIYFLILNLRVEVEKRTKTIEDLIKETWEKNDEESKG